MSTRRHPCAVPSAKDIMYPRLTLPSKERGKELINKLLVPYPALPVVNDNREVIGVVSEFDILDALHSSKVLYGSQPFLSAALFQGSSGWAIC